MPLLTVITATQERPLELKEALVSTLEQDCRDFEHLVVDDGSGSDVTSDVVADLKDERVRVIRLPASRGPAGARNAAVVEARGRYIAVLDDDDRMLPGRLAASARFLDDHPGHVLVASAFEAIDGQGRLIATVRPPTGEAKLRHILPRHNPFCHSTCAMRADVFGKLGGYREALRYSHDYDMVLRMAEQGGIEILEKPLGQYRFHTGNISTTRASMQGAFAEIARETAICRSVGTPEDLDLKVKAVEPRETDPRVAHARAHYQLGEWLFRDGKIEQARPHLWAAMKGEPWRPLVVGLTLAAWMPGWLRRAFSPLARRVAAARYPSWA